MTALSLLCSLQWLTCRFSRATPLNPYQASSVCEYMLQSFALVSQAIQP